MLSVAHPVGREIERYGIRSMASLGVAAPAVHLASHSSGYRRIGGRRLVQEAPREARYADHNFKSIGDMKMFAQVRSLSVGSLLAIAAADLAVAQTPAAPAAPAPDYTLTGNFGIY